MQYFYVYVSVLVDRHIIIENILKGVCKWLDNIMIKYITKQ